MKNIMFFKKDIAIKKLELKIRELESENTILTHINFALGGGKINIGKLRRELFKFSIENVWDKKHAEEADKINKALESKGEKIRQAWEKYKDEKLALEREKKDTHLIDAKLEILNILMEG